jgi:hypothetical protein
VIHLLDLTGEVVTEPHAAALGPLKDGKFQVVDISLHNSNDVRVV